MNKPALELSRGKVAARLTRGMGGAPRRCPRRIHPPDRPGHIITLPRHRTPSPGVARNTATAAGWI